MRFCSISTTTACGFRCSTANIDGIDIRIPTSLFLVVAGTLQIDIADGDRLELTEWQSVVIPAGVVHRTRAIGRTVNVTCEKKGAQTVFVDHAV